VLCAARIRGIARQYVSNSWLLEEISEERSIQGDDVLSQSVRRLFRERLALKSELEEFPIQLRAKFLLENRRGPVSTAGQYLSPGLVIWLERSYGVVGHADLR